MKRIRLTIAYDGTDYCGWQIQKNAVTVQGELEKALCRLLGREIEVAGASRTILVSMPWGMWRYLTQIPGFPRRRLPWP